MTIYLIKGEDANKFIEKVGGKLNNIELSKTDTTVIVMPKKRDGKTKRTMHDITKRKRGPKFKLNHFQIAKMIVQLRSGVTKGTISADYGISIPSIYNYQRKWEPILSNSNSKSVSGRDPNRGQHIKGQLAFNGLN